MRKKAKSQFLNRPIRVMLRFNKKEVRQVNERVKCSGLSRTEYGRRKILDIPIAEITRVEERQETQSAFGAKV